MIYRFDIYYDCTRPKGERFYNMSNPKNIDNLSSLLLEIKSTDNDSPAVLDFNYFMDTKGYVFYNKIDLREPGEKSVLKIKARIGVDYSYLNDENRKRWLTTSDENRWKELNAILEVIQRDEKINSLFL